MEGGGGCRGGGGERFGWLKSCHIRIQHQKQRAPGCRGFFRSHAPGQGGQWATPGASFIPIRRWAAGWRRNARSLGLVLLAPPPRAPPPPPRRPPLAPHPISPRCPPRRAASARGLAGAPLEPVGRGWGGKAGAPAEAQGRARDGAEFF